MHSRLGSAFTQVWFDNSTGQWVVAATNAAPSAAVAEAFGEAGLAGMYQLQRVSYDEQQLRESLSEVRDELAETLPSDSFAVGLGPGEVNVTVASGQSATGVQAMLTTTATSATAPSTSSGVPVNVEQVNKNSLAVSAGTVSCTFPYCNTIVGGDKWYAPDSQKSGKWFECSTGFYVGSSGDPYPLDLTAGHCDILAGNYNGWYTCDPGETNCGSYGHQIPFYYYGGGGGDAGLLEDDSFPIYGGYWNWSIGTLSTVEYYYSGGPAPDGVEVCGNGIGNGSSCGEVTADRYDNLKYRADEELGLPEETFNEMIQVTGACLIGGDSGGSITRATKQTAVGTWSGGEYEGTKCGPESYVEPIWREIEQLGIVIYGG